eukprot:gnl/Spiro4/4937_TR2461_c0_g1_i1.p1 gnl/Spiro4/4937_TR2461_c0_g1~~gnl/Spiro4/4937_TR2461_c0_g1_i1.p1  ORF type:complete len:410 (-),score=66.35 gnl/Spiro4/4937_TR2461_c0_g1_i1:138-1367(-)
MGCSASTVSKPTVPPSPCQIAPPGLPLSTSRPGSTASTPVANAVAVASSSPPTTSHASTTRVETPVVTTSVQTTATTTVVASTAFSRPITIGLMLDKRKMEFTNSLIQVGRREGLSVLSLDEDALPTAAAVDILLHKMTGELVLRTLDPLCDAAKKLTLVENYLRKYPTIVVVDPLSRLEVLTDRQVMATKLRTANLPEHVKIPEDWYIDLGAPDATSEDEKLRLIRDTNIVFPTICKPIMACSVPGSHDIHICMTETHLARLTGRQQVQRFYNHKGVIFKCYVIGDFITTNHKSSVRNLSREDKSLTGALRFDSQVMSDERLFPPIKHTVQPIPDSIVRDSVKAIEAALDISMFGVDFIVDEESGDIFVIDINYFPGYTNVANLEKTMLDHLLFVHNKVKLSNAPAPR